MSITKIQILRNASSGSAPSASVLDYGQLAINYGTSSLDGSPDGRLFYKDAGNIVRSISGQGSATTGGTGIIGTGSIGQLAMYSGSSTLTGSTLLQISTSTNTVYVSATLNLAISGTTNFEGYPYQWPAQSGNLSGSSYPSVGTVLSVYSIPTGSINTVLNHRVFSAGSGCFAPLGFSASVDDDVTTNWSSGIFFQLQFVGMQYVAKLNSTQSISRIAYTGIVGQNANALNIDTSIDGVNYYTQATVGSTVSPDVSFPPVFATHIRTFVSNANGGNYYGIVEFNAYTPTNGIRLAWVTQSAAIAPSASYALTSSYAVTASYAANGGSGGSSAGTITSGSVGQFSFYSGSQIISGSPLLVISGSSLILSASKIQHTGSFEVSGATVFAEKSYVWPLAYGVSGTFLSQDGAGNLAWSIASGSSAVGGSSVAVASASSQLIAAVTQLNFWGAGVTVSQSNNSASINITGGGTGLNSRVTTTTSAGIIASGSTMTGSIILAKTYAIQQITTNLQATRLRLYTTGSLRNVDVSRSMFSTPGGNGGLIFDMFFPSASSYTTFIVSPAVLGFNTDSTTNASFTIDNYSSGSANISMSITYVQLEA